jgi:hypothetical protein
VIRLMIDDDNCDDNYDEDEDDDNYDFDCL